MPRYLAAWSEGSGHGCWVAGAVAWGGSPWLQLLDQATSRSLVTFGASPVSPVDTIFDTYFPSILQVVPHSVGLNLVLLMVMRGMH